MRTNEQELCEAVIRYFENQSHAKRIGVTRPELDGSAPPVEIRFGLGDRKFAVEHTILEPFGKAIEWSVEFQAFAREIADTLEGAMPSPGLYDLYFPIHPTEGLHRRRHPAIRAEITAWVREMAAELHAECPTRPDRSRRPHGYTGMREVNISGIELKLRRTLHWAEGTSRHDGKLILSRLIEEDIETLRRERIAVALEKKLKKLHDCRRMGDETILVLEFGDIALTNHVAIAEALEPQLCGRDDLPDHILIADTTGERRWYLFHVLRDGVFSIAAEWIDVDSRQPNESTIALASP